MATKTDLKNAVKAFLNAVAPAATSAGYRRNRADSVYEAYVLTLVSTAFATRGWKLSLQGSKGAPAGKFIIRGSPGRIYSQLHNYGYLRAAKSGQDSVELHIDVQVVGNSGVLHEVDVSVFVSDHARSCCALFAQSDPQARKTRAAWECKFYADTPGVSLARTFVGLRTDLGGLWAGGLCANRPAAKIFDYLNYKTRPTPHPNLTPLVPAEEAKFILKVAGLLP